MKSWDTIWADNRVWFYRAVQFHGSHWETHTDDMICFATLDKLQSYPDYQELVMKGVLIKHESTTTTNG